MTQEQYDRVVTLNQRLEDLIVAKERLTDGSKYRLTYTYNGFSGRLYDIFPAMSILGIKKRCDISAILDRHDKQIRAEIDEEIEKLKKEIEEL